MQKTLALESGFDSEDVNSDNTQTTFLRQEIQQNYLKVEAYFQTLNVREITEIKKYTVCLN